MVNYLPNWDPFESKGGLVITQPGQQVQIGTGPRTGMWETPPRSLPDSGPLNLLQQVQAVKGRAHVRQLPQL